MIRGNPTDKLQIDQCVLYLIMCICLNRNLKNKASPYILRRMIGLVVHYVALALLSQGWSWLLVH